MAKYRNKETRASKTDDDSPMYDPTITYNLLHVQTSA